MSGVNVQKTIQSDKTDEELNRQILEAKAEKEEIELENLKIPFWQRLNFWLVALPVCGVSLTIIMAISQGYFTHLRQEMETRRVILESNNQDLARRGTELEARNNALEVGLLDLARRNESLQSDQIKLRAEAESLDRGNRELQARRIELEQGLVEVRNRAHQAELARIQAEGLEREAKLRARCVVADLAVYVIRWRGFSLASLPTLINRSVLNTFATSRLSWQQALLEELRMATGLPRNSIWQMRGSPGIDGRSPFVEQLLAQSLLRNLDQLVPSAFQGRPAGFSPTVVTGLQLLDSIKPFLAGHREAELMINNAWPPAGSADHDAMAGNLFFNINPALNPRMLDEGVDSSIATDAVRQITNEVMRHHRAHIAAARAFEGFEQRIRSECGPSLL